VKKQRITNKAEGEVTMSASELMKAADALTGVKLEMSHREIAERQNISREELEARHEEQQNLLDPQLEMSDGSAASLETVIALTRVRCLHP
jgi:hypothetical protein